MVELLTTKFKKNEYQPTNLIPGLMNIPKDMRQYGISYLNFCIGTYQLSEKNLHNMLIFFITEPPNSQMQSDYLARQERLQDERINSKSTNKLKENEITTMSSLKK